jgi:hypothetical protein
MASAFTLGSLSSSLNAEVTTPLFFSFNSARVYIKGNEIRI